MAKDKPEKAAKKAAKAATADGVQKVKKSKSKKAGGGEGLEMDTEMGGVERKGKGEAAAMKEKVRETTRLLEELDDDADAAVGGDGDGGVKMEVDVDVKAEGEGGKRRVVMGMGMGGLKGALVPFANPLADEKVGRKVLRGVKKGEFFFLLFLFSVFYFQFSVFCFQFGLFWDSMAFCFCFCFCFFFVIWGGGKRERKRERSEAVVRFPFWRKTNHGQFLSLSPDEYLFSPFPPHLFYFSLPNLNLNQHSIPPPQRPSN